MHGFLGIGATLSGPASGGHEETEARFACAPTPWA